ncbi:MAG TPA: diaminopimelate epimerase [Dehalococcoidia bacterium]|nr:diaminopimelate epimerase [Dehalococcoidia bacterium]
MRFVKMHGTGNDFVLLQPQREDEDWPHLARTLCDRHFGIGADGVILVLPSDRADVRMRIFNPDGSEAEMCGNGIRCLVRYAVETGLARPRDGQLMVETAAGVLPAWVDVEDGQVQRVRVGMGVPRFSPQEVPVRAQGPGPLLSLPLEVGGHRLSLTCLSLGNPHAVHFLDGPVEEFPLQEVGPAVEHHPLFPQRVNFGVARVLDRGHVELRVWERGAGPTLACGSGATAAVVAARLHDLVDSRVEVHLPGGTLTIEWDGRGEAYLSGPAQWVFEGRWLGQ